MDEIKNILKANGANDEVIAKICGLFEGMGMSGKVRITTHKVGTKEVLRQTPWFKNLLVSSTGYGRNLIAQRLGGTNAYTLNVTHGEIGTGSTAPQNSDIALTTPTVRGAMTTATVSNNVVQLQFFFSDAALANGTYYEFGSFIDGTGTIGTGRMLNHVLFGTPYQKNTGEDTTVEVDLTISSI